MAVTSTVAHGASKGNTGMRRRRSTTAPTTAPTSIGHDDTRATQAIGRGLASR